MLQEFSSTAFIPYFGSSLNVDLFHSKAAQLIHLPQASRKLCVTMTPRYDTFASLKPYYASSLFLFQMLAEVPLRKSLPEEVIHMAERRGCAHLPHVMYFPGTRASMPNTSVGQRTFVKGEGLS